MSKPQPKWFERGGIPPATSRTAKRLKGFTANAVAKIQQKRKAKKAA